MKKKNSQKDCIVLQEKLQELEKKLFNTVEKLKMYGYKDSSENADWIALDEERLKCQSQIDWLKAKIAGIDREGDKTVTYKVLETGEEITIRLTNGETDADQGKISRISPVGVAVNNKKLGEIVEVKTGQKKYQIQILNVKEK